MLMSYIIYSNIIGLLLLGIGIWMATKNNVWGCLVISLGSSIISLIGLVVAIIILKNNEEKNKIERDEEDNNSRYIE